MIQEATFKAQHSDEIDLEKEHGDDEEYSAEYKIDSYGADYPIEVLSEKFNSKELIVPDFQREYVWDIKRASRLIESFLLGLPVPQIFLYKEGEKDDLLVIDGQQRLRSIDCFIRGKWKDGKDFRLKGVLKEWDGKRYVDLQPQEKRKFNNRILRATIFEQRKPESDNSSIFQIFERLNSGGMELSKQEIRNCIYHGKLVEFLRELNDYDNWRKILSKKPDKRSKDVELILRMISMYYYWEEYEKPMYGFLNKAMKTNKDISEEKKEEIRKLFTEVIDVIFKKLGKKAFRPVRSLSAPVAESVFVGIAKSSDWHEAVEKYDSLMNDKEYQKLIKEATTDTDTAKKRVMIAIKHFSR